MISSLDHALIGLYLICVIFAGILVKSPRSNSGYIFAGRKLTVPAFVMTLVSTWYGGILEVGRFAHINGISTILIFGLFYYIAALVYAYAMVPKIKSSQFETIPQAISSAFGKKSGVVAALLILFISSPAPYIKILSVFLDFLYGITPLYGALLCAAVSILYTLRGGFQAVIKTDIIQFAMMFAGFFFILVFLYSEYGGYSFLSSSLSSEMISIPGGMSWSYIIVWGFIAMLTFIDPNFYQRTFAGISTGDVQRGICISVLFWLVFDLMSISVALYAAAIIPEVIHSPYLDLVSVALPPIAQGLFIISMMSVVMSTVDSFLFISGCTIGKDLLPLVIRTEDKQIIPQIKIGIIVSGAISVVLATFFENALDIWYVSGSFAVSCIMIPLLCVLYRVKLRFPLISIVIPGVVTLLWFCFGSPSVDPMYPGLASSLICFILFR